MILWGLIYYSSPPNCVGAWKYSALTFPDGGKPKLVAMNWDLNSASFIRSASPKEEDCLTEENMSQAFTGSSVVGIHCRRQDYPVQKTTTTTMEDFKKKGRNTFAFWVLIIMLFALTLANLALTMTIISVLRFGRGMEYMELVPEANSVKFFGDVDLDRIQKRDGILEGFSDVPMSIEGDAGGSVLFNLIYRNGHVHNKFYMGQNETHFKNINHFEVRSPVTRDVIFNTAKPVFNMVGGGTKNLKSNTVTASAITSALDQNLVLQTRGKMIISGAEGVTLDAKKQLWSADQNINLWSKNGSIILGAANGIYIDTQKMPVVQMENGIRSAKDQYKLCVCMPSGNLFQVPIPQGIHASKITCNHIEPDFKPCE